jgi:hypothetical protein
MEKQKLKKGFKKAYPISAEKRILLFRRDIRYYPYPYKAKLKPVCS